MGNERLPNDRLARMVAGALRCTITAHGPVTLDTVPSATKRIVAQLTAPDSPLVQAVVDARLAEMERRFNHLRHGHERLLARYERLRERAPAVDSTPAESA